MSDSTYPCSYNLPSFTRDGLKRLARERDTTIAAAAVQVLRDALPEVREGWQEYEWPPTRRQYVQRHHRTTVMFGMPHDLRLGYVGIANKLVFRAAEEGRYAPPKDVLGNTLETFSHVDWLIRAVLVDHTPSAGHEIFEPRAPKQDPISGGPLVQVPLPQSVVAWLDRNQYNRSAFIRGAIDAQLPALTQADAIPPLSKLMVDVPQQTTPVRMARTMHESLKAAATSRRVPMTHILRAACLTHLAQQTARKPA